MNGIDCLLKGFKLIVLPGVRRYVVGPLVINILLFVAMFFLARHYYVQLMQWVEHFLPNWLQWLAWLFWLLFIITFLVILTYGFTLLANLLGAPFNGLLAEKVEEKLTGRKSADATFMSVMKEIPRALKRQLQFMGYYLLRALVMLLLFFIPGIHIAVSPLWFLFNGWMMSVQYMDYPMDNHRIDFKPMIRLLSEERWPNFSFGCFVMFLTMIPIVNLIIMPAAVAGATALYVTYYTDSLESG